MKLETLIPPFLDLSPDQRWELVRLMRDRRSSGGMVKVNKLVDMLIKDRTPEEIAEIVKRVTG